MRLADKKENQETLQVRLKVQEASEASDLTLTFVKGSKIAFDLAN